MSYWLIAEGVMEIRRRVVGEGEVITEIIKKEMKTKNKKRQTVIRDIIKAIKLDCGHLIPVTNFKNAPTRNTRCYECENTKLSSTYINKKE